MVTFKHFTTMFLFWKLNSSWSNLSTYSCHTNTSLKPARHFCVCISKCNARVVKLINVFFNTLIFLYTQNISKRSVVIVTRVNVFCRFAWGSALVVECKVLSTTTQERLNHTTWGLLNWLARLFGDSLQLYRSRSSYESVWDKWILPYYCSSPGEAGFL